MTKTQILDGVSVVDVPEAGLSVLCGCPENAVKFLRKSGVIRDVEKNGQVWETGPNAILLSEVPVQNGRFRNLGEFPVLQMLYKQGMIVPGHPNNTGRRPMIIGLRDQVEAQSHYIYLGNYGQTAKEELERAGMAPHEAEEMLRMKLKFSFGHVRKTEELLELKVLDGPAIELRDGLFVRRSAMNRYEFIYEGESIEVDLNPSPDAGPAAPYALPYGRVPREYFSVVHIGEGDGWDAERPCMGSILMYRGEAYLIDAGPNIAESLEAAGLGVDDLAGIFQTHTHDDHFVGLTALLRANRRLRFHAVPWVRAAVEQKLCALSGLREDEFSQFFDIRDLVEGQWNDLEGLEVLPSLSPHPVETTILRFRALGDSGYRTYAHMADLASFKIIDSLTSADPKLPGISKDLAERTKKIYLEAADLKKIDVGGGMIHGSAEDFAEDTSGILLLSHTNRPPTKAEKAIGSTTSFGAENRLIAARRDYGGEVALAELGRLFPAVPHSELDVLVNCERVFPNEGIILMKKGARILDLYLILAGIVESIDLDSGRVRILSSGSLVGCFECLEGKNASLAYRTRSRVEAIRIPAAVYHEFVRRTGMGTELRRISSIATELAESPLFAEFASMASLFEIAQAAESVRLAEGIDLPPRGNGDKSLYILAKGKASIYSGGNPVESLVPGDFFGEEAILFENACLFGARAEGEAQAWRLPAKVLEDKPVLLWQLRETHERRLSIVKTVFAFEWRSEYGMDNPELDEQHQCLFILIESINHGLVVGRSREATRLELEELEAFVHFHVKTEEGLMRSCGFPGLASHVKEHEILLEELKAHRTKIDSGTEGMVAALASFLKDWILRHTLRMDRQYAPYIERRGMSPAE